MSKQYPIMVERGDGWCDWVSSKMNGYKMACCSCGLVHRMQFQVVKFGKPVKGEAGVFTFREVRQKGVQVIFRAQRDERATAAFRREKKKREKNQ